jgi:hypothetical protein
MPRKADEINYLLGHSAVFDLLVKEFTQNLVDWGKSQSMEGISYSVNDSGFTVAVFGLTLKSRYEQVKDAAEQFPDLYARISVCLSDDEGRLSTPVHTILLDKNGTFSADGTKDVRFHRGDLELRALGFKSISMLIASAVIDGLPTLA